MDLLILRLVSAIVVTAFVGLLAGYLLMFLVSWWHVIPEGAFGPALIAVVSLTFLVTLIAGEPVVHLLLRALAALARRP